MSKNTRVSLLDPLLYKSSYVDNRSPSVTNLNFWKRFSFLNFSINILLPILLIVFILFVLKGKYQQKERKKFLNTYN